MHTEWGGAETPAGIPAFIPEPANGSVHIQELMKDITVDVGSQGPAEPRVTNPGRVPFAPSRAGDKCKRV